MIDQMTSKNFSALFYMYFCGLYNLKPSALVTDSASHYFNEVLTEWKKRKISKEEFCKILKEIIFDLEAKD